MNMSNYRRKKRSTQTYEKMAEMAQYAESLQSIRRAMSEQSRALDEFTAEFEAEHDICR